MRSLLDLFLHRLGQLELDEAAITPRLADRNVNRANLLAEGRTVSVAAACQRQPQSKQCSAAQAAAKSVAVVRHKRLPTGLAKSVSRLCPSLRLATWQVLLVRRTAVSAPGGPSDRA